MLSYGFEQGVDKMAIIFKLLVVMFSIVFMLKKKIKLGNCMLFAMMILFVLVAPRFEVLIKTMTVTVTSFGTYNLLIAMYLVMCLEFQLRTKGIFDGFMSTVKKKCSDKILLAVMPTVIGFLPSLGGAIMSCPMVENAAGRFQLSPEKKSTINYWFRHVSEYINPIVPTMLLASVVLEVALRDLMLLLIPFGILFLILGWIFLIQPLREAAVVVGKEAVEHEQGMKYIFLALGPIFVNMLLVTVLNLDASLSLGLVILAMVFILKQNTKDVVQMIKEAYSFKLLWGLFGIVCFQNMFNMSGAVTEFLTYMETTAVPIGYVVMAIAFLGGFLCGVGQSVVALAFPIIAAMPVLDWSIVICAYVFGTAGQMMSPVHLCYPMTVEYFKADMVKPMYPVIALELVMMVAVIVWTKLLY